MNYLLDANILLTYLRGKKERLQIESDYDSFGVDNNPIISIVSVGEIKSIAKRNYWGSKKMNLLDDILNSLIIIDINSEDHIEKYAEIDAFSQGKLIDNPLPLTARNMGKNDIWIAATATVTNSKLITTAEDFRHLHDKYSQAIEIEY